MVIGVFFLAHWALAVFVQSFFLHRYSAHRYFSMSRGWERFFHFLTFVAQNASYLNPRAYGILHRMHHAYSDTPSDPHTPTEYGNPLSMMWNTKNVYTAVYRREFPVEPRFETAYPSWPMLEGIGDAWVTRIGWMALTTLFYVQFATSPWLFLLLPVHWLMGPLHGAIVNWCGHKYGYQNFDNGDESRNTLPMDFLIGGELFQNNHHKYSGRVNFAYRRFEVDPVYWVVRGLAFFRVLKLNRAEVPKVSTPTSASVPGEGTCVV